MSSQHQLSSAEKARLVVDYRSINGVLERPAFIIMMPHEVKSSIKESWNFFFSADMTSGYFQIPLAEESRELTTFIIPQGRFTYNVTPKGLQPSGDTFSQQTRCLIEGENTGNLKSLDDQAGGENNTQEMWKRIKNLCETC